MKAKYKCTIDFELYYDVDTPEDLKSDREIACDIGVLILDEVVNADGVVTFNIVRSSMDVYGKTDEERKEMETPEWKQNFYDKFIKLH